MKFACLAAKVFVKCFVLSVCIPPHDVDDISFDLLVLRSGGGVLGFSAEVRLKRVPPLGFGFRVSDLGFRI